MVKIVNLMYLDCTTTRAYLFYVSVCALCMYVLHVCAEAHGGQKKMSDLLEPELEVVVS